jgi:predicted dehydrogenase
MRRVWELLRSGAVGELREVQANFFFAIRDRGNIRLAPDLYGGSLNDVGCYCLRLAQLVFEAAPEEALATAVLAPEGVDEEMHGVIRYAGNRHLTFACGLNRRYDASARLLGTEGEIRLSNPYHPNLRDTLELRQTDRETVEHLGEPGATFTPAIAHIHAALRGEEEPRHTALDDSLATAQALAMVHAAAGSPFVPAIAHS